MKKKRIAQSGSFSLRLVLCAAAVCSMIAGTLPATAGKLGFFHPEAPSRVSERALTFAERVSYQRAIEEVYWRHRIWPAANASPKPLLGKVMSQAQIEKKVEDYMGKSQALEDYWQRPLSPEELQAEMDRMAQHTKQPAVLRELFEALGDDPFMIAECLARPVLAERTLVAATSVKKPGAGKPQAHAPIKVAAIDSITKVVQVNRPYRLPAISSPSGDCIDDTWTPTSINNAGFGRLYFTAVWTGTEMIVWGGVYDYYPVNTGERYNPATDSWTETTTNNAPQARAAHTAVWTGSEMIVWAGDGVLLGDYLNTGGTYNPLTDSWRATSTLNAPAPRETHTAIWTGSEMIVWGGWNGSTRFNTGGRYNPTTDSWSPTDTTTAPSARQGQTAIWTGSEMVVWGGYFFDGTSHWLNTGGRYNPVVDSWTSTSTIHAPTGRWHHTAVWTGGEMVVWGGYDGNGDVNTGGRYHPATDTWTPTSTINAPSARDDHTAVWTGSEMIVWGGCPNCFFGSGGRSDAASAPAPAPTPSEPPPTPPATATPTVPPVPGTGGRYAPDTDSWRATSTTNAPSDRFGHTAVWTGSEMIIWGGAGPGYNLNDGGRYCANLAGPTPTPTPTATPTLTPTPTPCTGRCAPTPRPRLTMPPRP
jgi:N-acetylneuraminic acid mutarotase